MTPEATLPAAPTAVSGEGFSRAPKRLLPVVAGLAAVTIWAATPTLVKLSVADLPVGWFILLRYGVTTLLLAGLIPGVLKRLAQVKPRTWALIVVPGMAHVFLQAFSLQKVPVSWYVLAFALSPLVTFLLLRKTLSRALTVSLLLAAAGALAFVEPDEVRQLPSLVGVFELLGSVAAWVAVTVGIVQLHKSFGDLQIATILTVVTFIGAAAVFVIQGAQVHPTSLKHVGLVAGQAVLVPGGFALFSYAVRRLPVFGIASQYLELVLGVVIAWWVFHESLAARQLIGGLLVIAGLAIVSRFERSPAPA